jgi:hypothetical protein
LATVPGRFSVRSRPALCCDRTGCPVITPRRQAIVRNHAAKAVLPVQSPVVTTRFRVDQGHPTAFRRAMRMSRSPPVRRATRYGATDRHNILKNRVTDPSRPEQVTNPVLPSDGRRPPEPLDAGDRARHGPCGTVRCRCKWPLHRNRAVAQGAMPRTIQNDGVVGPAKTGSAFGSEHFRGMESTLAMPNKTDRPTPKSPRCGADPSETITRTEPGRDPTARREPSTSDGTDTDDRHSGPIDPWKGLRFTDAPDCNG